MSEQLKKIKQLVEMRLKAKLGGGEKAIEKQHEKGKATARERIDRCSTRVLLKKWICSSSIAATTLAWKTNTSWAMA